METIQAFAPTTDLEGQKAISVQLTDGRVFTVPDCSPEFLMEMVSLVYGDPLEYT